MPKSGASFLSASKEAAEVLRQLRTSLKNGVHYRSMEGTKLTTLDEILDAIIKDGIVIFDGVIGGQQETQTKKD